MVPWFTGFQPSTVWHVDAFLILEWPTKVSSSLDVFESFLMLGENQMVSCWKLLEDGLRREQRDKVSGFRRLPTYDVSLPEGKRWLTDDKPSQRWQVWRLQKLWHNSYIPGEVLGMTDGPCWGSNGSVSWQLNPAHLWMSHQEIRLPLSVPKKRHESFRWERAVEKNTRTGYVCLTHSIIARGYQNRAQNGSMLPQTTGDGADGPPLPREVVVYSKMSTRSNFAHIKKIWI